MIKDIIKQHKILLSVFVVSATIGGFIFLYLYSGIVAIVEGELIWKKDLNKTVDLMVKYYDTDSHHSSTSVLESEFFKDENLLKRIQKETITKMIDYKILVSELENRNLDWKSRARAKIDDAISQTKDSVKFEEGVKAIYGMDYSEFKDRVLMPQAQFEILAEELKKENKNYDEWLKNKKKNMKVKIFIDGLEWKDGQVQIAQ